MLVYLSVLGTVFLALSVRAQSSVPPPLSSSFDSSAIQLQVSYNGDAFNGFADGSTVPLSNTRSQPVFALGDASGVNTAISFFVMMVDTTDMSDIVLHFLQTDFKASGGKTGIASASQPLVTYQAPGAFGETGSRQYSFLLYEQTGDGNLQGIPQGGENFDVTSFENTNDLSGAEAGIAMFVDVPGSISSTSTNDGGVTATTSSAAVVTTTLDGILTSSNLIFLPSSELSSFLSGSFVSVTSNTGYKSNSGLSANTTAIGTGTASTASRSTVASSSLESQYTSPSSPSRPPSSSTLPLSPPNHGSRYGAAKLTWMLASFAAAILFS